MAKKNSKINLSLGLVFLLTSLTALTAQKSSFQGHAHNDYRHPEPFHTAFDLGLRSFEIDVISSRRGLMISHLPFKWKSPGSMEDLYFNDSVVEKLAPLDTPISYLIDVKSRSGKCLIRLRALKIKYNDLIFDKCTNTNGKIKLILSGKVPLKLLTEADLCFLFIDSRPFVDYTTEQKENIASCSMSIRKLHRRFERNWESALSGICISMKRQNIPVRLWGIPQDEANWSALIESGVQIINVDDLELFHRFKTNIK